MLWKGIQSPCTRVEELRPSWHLKGYYRTKKRKDHNRIRTKIPIPIGKASDAILLADMKGNLVEVNRKAEQLLGYTKSELLGVSIAEIHTREQTDRILNTFNNIIINNFSTINHAPAVKKTVERAGTYYRKSY